MNQPRVVYLVLTFSLLIFLSASVLFFSRQSDEQRIENLSDHIVSNFRAGLAYEMADLLSFSLALSEDGELKNALLSEDENKGYIILSKISDRFKKFTHIQSLRLQVLTPDYFIFARSWDQGFEGMPMSWFRDDLRKLKHNKKPKVGMETGLMLTFKATIPIRSGNKLLGYLEAIKLVDEFTLKLRKKGIELFALMDAKYLDKAALMRDFPQMHGHVIANQNYNQKLIPQIKKIDWKELRRKSYLRIGKTLFILEPMYNGEEKEIGSYLLILPYKALERYEKKNQDTSFFTQFSDEDINQVVAQWQHPYGSYRSGYDRDLIEMLPKLNQEDKVGLEAEAKELLQEYTKDELIDIILENKHLETKRGEIE